MRKTKIVCTLGPATDKGDILEQLVLKGMNVARLNFSHGNHEEHKVRIDRVKELRKKHKKPVGLLLDTKGPEIRLKKFENGLVELKEGDFFTLTTRDVLGNESLVSVTYNNLPDIVDRGDKILIDDGLIELKVVSTTDTDVECAVISGGEISNRKGVNLPGITIDLPFISDRDKEDILFAIENDFEFIAASFARNAEDMKDLITFVEENNGGFIKIIAKIENRDGVNNIDDIVSISDGLMVARGDMGVEIPFEELPSIQKEIIKKSNYSGKTVITATQMLDSMIRNPRPTRAEITDVANAIYDGTSAIMLSGETSIGKYPVEAVQTMSKIAMETEKNIDYIKRFKLTHVEKSRNVTNAISHATCETAHSLGASAIITVTKSGHTAKMVSKYRPSPSIIGATVTEKIYNQLALTWGVHPILTEVKNTTDDIFNQAIDTTHEAGIIKNGDLVVITGGMLADISGTTNMMKVHIVGDVLVEGKGVTDVSATGIVCVLDGRDNEINNFNAGNVLVIKSSSDEILRLIKNASAVITEEKAEESKAVIIGKALEIPLIAGADHATEILKSGTIVTVKGSEGRVYSASKISVDAHD